MQQNEKNEIIAKKLRSNNIKNNSHRALCRNKRYRALLLYRKMWYNDSKIQMLRICRALRFTILSFTNSAQVSKLPCVVNL